MTPRNQNALRSGPDRQGGVVLLIALIVLIAMSLIGISMIRQGSSAQLIVGNLAFKEGTNAATDYGLERAAVWLRTQTSLEINLPDSGYVANGLNSQWINFNPYTSDAYRRAPSIPPELSQLGMDVFYVIHRLCTEERPVTTTAAGENQCIVARETSSKEGTSYGNNPSPELFPYYRITVRVTGPRNVTSYVQALMY